MKKLTPMLENAGVKILSNEKKTLEYKSVSFDIIGIEDIYTTEIEKAVSVFEDNENFQLVLVHQPQFVDRIMDKLENSKSLVLSGHTHGGQIRIPFMKTLYAPNQGFLPKYGDGLYELANSKLFISRGIGGTGKMPLRIFNRPEICLLTLKKDN